jgi:hypothetical protein
MSPTYQWRNGWGGTVSEPSHESDFAVRLEPVCEHGPECAMVLSGVTRCGICQQNYRPVTESPLQDSPVLLHIHHENEYWVRRVDYDALWADNERLREALGAAIVHVPNHSDFIEHYGLDWIK